MRIYIAGKYTGLKHADAVAKFAHTKKQLMAAGIAENHIVNPMELGIAQDEQYELALEICLHHLGRCNAVLMQYDWRESNGAIREYNRANELGLPVFDENQEGILAVSAWYGASQAINQVFTYATSL